MVMIQDGPQNTGADKPLRITGDPYKVQVNLTSYFIKSWGWLVFGKELGLDGVGKKHA